MKNTTKFLGIIALQAVIGFSMAALSLTGCGDGGGGGSGDDEAKTLVITGLSDAYQYGDVRLFTAGTSHADATKEYALIKNDTRFIAGAGDNNPDVVSIENKVTYPLYFPESNNRWTGTGSYIVIFYYNPNKGGDVKPYIASNVSFTNATTTISFKDKFTEVTDSNIILAAPVLRAQGSSAAITLTWTAINGASGYTVYASPNGSTEWEYCGLMPSTATTLPIPDVEVNVTYYFKIAAVSANGTEGTMSNVASAKKSSSSSSSSTFTLRAQAVSSTRIDLSWDAVTGAAEYYVFISYSSTSGFDPINIELTTACSVLVSQPNTTFYFLVIAANASGEAFAMSTTTSATTLGGSQANPLDGDWTTLDGRSVVKVNGNTGKWTKFPPQSGALFADAISKGIVGVGANCWTNIKSTGTSTWSGQVVIGVINDESNPNVAKRADTLDCIFTLSADGRTLNIKDSNPNAVNPYNVTVYRQN